MTATAAKLGPMPSIEHIAYDRRPFIESIWDNPDDDAPLLVYSDWLDEHEENGKLVRWWVRARREYAPTIETGKKKVEFDDIRTESKKLFDSRGRTACVLATVALKTWQEKLHPVDWGLFRKYHDDVDALKAQLESAWFTIELAGMRLLPLVTIGSAGSSAYAAGMSAYAAGRSAYAAGRSAYAAGSSAYAAGRSAYAALNSAYAAGRSADAALRSAYAAGNSADAALNSADAAGRSADAALNSAYAAGRSAYAAGSSADAALDSAYAAGSSAQQKLMRIAVAVFSAEWWKYFPIVEA